MTKTSDKFQDMYVNKLIIIVSLGLGFFSFGQNHLMPESLINLGKGPYYTRNAIVVDKTERSVTIWEQGDSGFQKIKSYAADFGKSSGDKTSLGDHKTPEGIYYFLGEIEKANLDFREYGYHEVKAYPMNYPNLFDQREGKTGSGIWLHAVPEKAPLSRGSRGCVTLTKQDTDDIGQFIQAKNTPIIVHDKINYISTNEGQTHKTHVVVWLKKWLETWQHKNIDDYMSFYSEEFKSRGMSFSQWKTYKKGLSENYSEIKVSISEPRILKFKDEWVVEFIQKYESDKYTDFGKKTLYLKGNMENLKIIAEDFNNTKSQNALAQFGSSNFSCCEDLRSLTTTSKN